jgi:hypothetical protein
MKLAHRTVLVLAVALLQLPAFGAVSAQPAEDNAKEKPAPLWTLPTDEKASTQLKKAADAIQQEDWANAVRLVQQLLDGTRDALARLTDRDGKKERHVSVHAEAERLLATMPAAGRKLYQQTYGPHASALLDEARADRDAKLFARIVDRYLYTDSGLAALGELARWHYNGGRMLLAAAAYTRLREHVGPARWTNDDLYQAAIAFQKCGMSAKANLMLKEMAGRARQGTVRLGKQGIPLVELHEKFENAAESPRHSEWPVFRGDAARSNRGAGGPPVLEALWRQSMLYERGDIAQRAARDRLRQAEKLLHERHEPILPAFSPIVISVQERDQIIPLVLFKNYLGVMAYDLRNSSLRWAFPSNWSLQRLLSQGGSKQALLVQWLSVYEKHYPQILFENSTSGTLSTDGDFVYVVEDLTIPPWIVPVQRKNSSARMPPPRIDFHHIQVRGAKDRYDLKPPAENTLLAELDRETEDAVLHNRLNALSLAKNGALTWALGDDEKDPLHDCYFLGPPLPLHGLLYVLVQRKQQVSLLCIDPRTGKQRFPEPKIVFAKPLVDLRTSLLEDSIRRTQAAHLAYSDGILVCPTNAGVVLGVDLLLNRLAWAYPYRDKGEKVKDSLAPESSKHWKTIAPVISEDKVVFTPPDDPSIFCLNLTDGSLLWSRKKSDDDLYLAGVHAGNVLIVGKKNVQALSLTKGEIVWTQETGFPSGQGLAAGNLYYLPLQRSAKSKQPEILALDIHKGQVIAHHKTRPRKPNGEDFEVPGNLVFIEGKLISLTPWEIVAYPTRGGK